MKAMTKEGVERSLALNQMYSESNVTSCLKRVINNYDKLGNNIANSQFNSCSRKVTNGDTEPHLLHINYFSRFQFSRIGCAHAKFTKYKRLENESTAGADASVEALKLYK